MKNHLYKELIHGIIQHNPQAMKELYKQLLDATGKTIRYYVLKNSGTKEDFEDLFQEAFFQFVIRIQENRFTYESDRALIALFVQFAKGKWRDQLKKNQRQNGDINRIPPREDQSDFYKEIENKDFFDHLWPRIGEQCKELLTLWYWHGMKAPELQEVMGFTSPRAVHVQKFSCMQKLRNFLSPSII